MAEAVADAVESAAATSSCRPAPGTGKTPRLPRARAAVRAAAPWWPPPPRRCRTSWPARTSRSSPSTSTRPFEWAVLKGRSNYLCLPAPAGGRAAGDGQLALDDDLLPSARRRGRGGWRRGPPRPTTGDQAELDWSAERPRPGPAVSVTQRGVPGRRPLPARREPCFAEAARRPGRGGRRRRRQHPPVRHRTSASGRRRPPRARRRGDRRGPPARGHHVGHRRRRRRRRPLRRRWPGSSRRIVDDPSCSRPRSATPATTLADALAAAPRPAPAARRCPTTSADAARGGARSRVDDAPRRAASASTTDVADANQRKIRAQKAAGSLAEDLDAALALPDGYVAWVGGPADEPRLEVAPLDVGARARASGVWRQRTAILTSATDPGSTCPDRVGLPADGTDAARRRQPVRLRGPRAPLLRRPPARPAPPGLRAGRARRAGGADHAAGGRTLALFTSWRAMNEAAADALRARLPFTDPHPGRPAEAGAARAPSPSDETSCLFATVGLFQGVDVPGRDAVSLVTIDRLPVPPARRSAARGPPGAGRRRRLPRRSTCPGPPRCWPRPPAG